MDGCIPMEALGTLDALGPGDPTRRHVEQCARCSALVVAYREFVRAEVPSGARVADADTRMAAFIAERVEGVEATGGSRRPRGRWFEMPTFRWAAAAAVMAILAGTVAKWMQGSEQTAVRGDAHIVLTLETPRLVTDGAVELNWTSVPDADAYEVVLLRDDLSEVVRLPATSERELTLDRSAIPAGATHWQVTALREGAVAAESTPAALPK